MNVFITGIAGFLGSNLSHYLTEKGYSVFGVDNLVGGKATNVSGKAIGWITDCRNIDEMSFYLEMAKPEIIIHTACYPHEGLSVFSPNEICDSVINGTTSVLSSAINLRNKTRYHFVNL
jgi:Nucleoside-diphosphate-sugar epimerases